jgi:peptidoglycan/xylan/chitin deacetylase (PgdA/CDA1 family)
VHREIRFWWIRTAWLRGPRQPGWRLKAIVAMLTLIAGAQAMPAESAGLPILVYHQIRDTPDGPRDSDEVISLEKFESQMKYLHDHGYRTLSADEVVDYIRFGGKHTKVVAIHFDDGWKSAQLALPALNRYGFKATFWIIAGKGIGWPHMDWEEVLAIAANPRYDIGSHSMTHPWKRGDTMLDWIHERTPGKGIEQVRWELAESRRVLTQKLGRPVHYFAWPAGHHDDAMVQLAVEAGYVALFTIRDGVNQVGTNPLRVQRTMIHGGCDESMFVRMLADGIQRDCGPAADGR